MFRHVIMVFATLMSLTGSVAAQGWHAIVIGQPGVGAARAFADSFHAAQAFRTNGFETVALLRDAPRQDLEAAFSDAAGAERVVIYFAGPLLREGTTLQVKDDVLELSAFVEWFQQANITQASILIENCADPKLKQSQLSFPPIPDEVEVYLAASVGPGEDCSAIDTRLTDRLKAKIANPGGSLQESLSGLPVFSTLLDPIALRVPDTDVAGLGAPTVSVVASDVVSISPVAAPAQASAVLSPVVAAPRPTSSAGTGSVVVFEPPPDTLIAALPVAAGLPDPYIIVGLLPEQQVAFDTVAAPLDVGATEITYENLAERQRLRAEQPDLFETLVSNGAFDPPEQLLVVALQTELARMRCYTAGIDGQWGGGSRRSVTRYFDEIEGIDAVSLDPEIPLFRQIIRRDDVTCPAPVARAPAATAPTRRATSTGTSRRTTATPRRQAAPAPARTQQPARRQSPTIRLGTGTGVFR